MAAAMRICLFLNRHNLSRQQFYETNQFSGKVPPLRGRVRSIWFRRSQGPLIRVCGMSIDAYFHGNPNDTIGG